MYFRHLKLAFIFIISGFLIFGIQTQSTAQQIDPNNLGQNQPDMPDNNGNKAKAKYAPGRFIVKFKSEGLNAVNEDTEYILESKGKFKNAVSDNSDSLDNLMQKHNVKGAKSVFIERHGLTTVDAKQKQKDMEHLSKAKHQSRSRRAPKDATFPDLSNVCVFEVPPESDVEAIVREFQADPHVEYAQPDYVMETYMVPNDPYYSSFGSWGQSYDDLWGLKKIQAEQAWDVTQGEGIVVAVVDSGLDYNHPDIAANVWTNAGEILNNGIDDDGNGKVDDIRGWDFINNDNDPMDGHGHGTHVSGTIAAVGNNGIGIIGVAPKAKIMPLKGLGDTGSGPTSALANGIVYAARNGADVINNSWGCSTACPSNPVAEDAVRTAYNLGAVVVFAAGNSSADVSQYSPQNMTDSKPVVVSAGTPSDMPANFTNFGMSVDVAAPGTDILSLKRATTGYVRMSGTSMATPHTAGAAALVLANHPTFTNEEVRRVLRASADDVNWSGFDVKTGMGRINAAEALTITSVPSAKIISPASGTSYNPDQFITITGTAGGSGFKQHELFYGIGATPSSWVSLGPPVEVPVQDAILGSFLAPDPLAADVDYSLRLVVTSTSGAQFDDIIHINITKFKQITTNTANQTSPAISGNLIVWQDYRNGSTPDIYFYAFPSHPPELASIGNKSVNEGQMLTFTISAMDPDGDSLTYSATGLPGGASFSGQTFSWTPTFVQSGSYPVTFAVSDGVLSDEETITITVADVPAPDLITSALSTTATAVTRGNSFTLSNTVKNQGTALAGSFTIAFSLSTDAIYGGTDDIAFSTTRSVSSLAAGASSGPISTSLTVPATTPLGNYYVCAKADSGNTVTESEETNNDRCTTTTIQIALPDLVMTAISGPASGVTGTSVGFVNTVKNQGGSKAASFSVGFYLSTDAVITTTDTRIGTRGISTLAAGATNSATTTLALPTTLTAGTYYIGAIADYNSTRPETDETNNALTGNAIVLTIGADLVVSAVSGPATAPRGTSVPIANTVVNQGTGSSSSSYIGFYLSTDAAITTSDRYLGRRSVGTLAAGATSSATTNMTIPTTIAVGTYYIGAIADYTNTAKENNETNNTLTGNTVIVQ